MGNKIARVESEDVREGDGDERMPWCAGAQEIFQWKEPPRRVPPARRFSQNAACREVRTSALGLRVRGQTCTARHSVSPPRLCASAANPSRQRHFSPRPPSPYSSAFSAASAVKPSRPRHYSVFSVFSVDSPIAAQAFRIPRASAPQRRTHRCKGIILCPLCSLWMHPSRPRHSAFPSPSASAAPPSRPRHSPAPSRLRGKTPAPQRQNPRVSKSLRAPAMPFPWCVAGPMLLPAPWGWLPLPPLRTGCRVSC